MIWMNKELKILKALLKYIIGLQSSRTRNKNKVKKVKNSLKYCNFIYKQEIPVLFMNAMSILR